jgi:hypothetical protein
MWSTVAILCNFLSSTSLISAKSFLVCIVSNDRPSHANITIFPWANCLTMTLLQCYTPVVFECVQSLTSHMRDTLAYTLSRYCTSENPSHATFERFSYLECESSYWHHNSGISSNQHVLQICI